MLDWKRWLAVRQAAMCVGLTMWIAACGGGGDGGTAPTPPAVATVAVTLAQPSIVVGSNTTATAVLRDAGGATLSNRTIAWSSSNPSIASVSDAGIISTLSVGEVTISATSEGRVGSALLSVIPPPVATITVTLAQPELLANTSTNATAVLRDANGNVLTNRSIAWSSSSSPVASVSAAGVVTALAAGSTMITATSEGRSGSAMLTVQLPPVATVTVSGASRVKVGDTYNYSATLRLGDGTVVTRPIAWSITDPTRASITQTGVLTAVRPGSFTIQLTIDGVVWTSDYAAYDWEALSGSGSLFAFLPADNTITNRFGTANYSELVISCGSTGFFFVWVRTPHVITASGQVALSFDGGSPFSQTWDELSPNFTSLWKPGSNATIKAFAFDIERLSLFGFAFSEFLGSAKAVFFRVRGLGPLLTPIVAACPSSAITASADMIATDVAAQRRVLESLRPTPGGGTSAAAAMRVHPSGPVAAPSAGFAELVDSMTALPQVHSQVAQRRR